MDLIGSKGRWLAFGVMFSVLPIQKKQDIQQSVNEGSRGGEEKTWITNLKCEEKNALAMSRAYFWGKMRTPDRRTMYIERQEGGPKKEKRWGWGRGGKKHHQRWRENKHQKNQIILHSNHIPNPSWRGSP